MSIKTLSILYDYLVDLFRGFAIMNTHHPCLLFLSHDVVFIFGSSSVCPLMCAAIEVLSLNVSSNYNSTLNVVVNA
jgi:hypothetical protein